MVRFPIPLQNGSVWKSWMSKTDPTQGIVKRDWVATGRIDFATHVTGNAEDADQPSNFKLMVEERRIVESVTGLENLEIRWRQATLREARIVVVQYHKYLVENSLIKFVVDEAALVPRIPPMRKLNKPEPAENSAAMEAPAT